MSNSDNKINLPVFQSMETEFKMDSNGHNCIFVRCESLSRSKKFYKDHLRIDARELQKYLAIGDTESIHIVAALQVANALDLDWDWNHSNIAIGVNSKANGFNIVQYKR